MWVCLLEMQTKNIKNILNEKIIEERCEMYFKTMNTRFEAIDKNWMLNAIVKK